jgi:hypothetical protein
LPVPPLRSRPGKPTRLEIARQELQKELDKPSEQVNIRRVKELQEKIEELEDRWRKRSMAQKRARKQRKQSLTGKTSQKITKTGRRAYSSRSRLRALTESRLGKFTRLQVVRHELARELSKLPEYVNINSVRKLRKKKERLEKEWHNRSRAQKQAWRWRKKVAEIVGQKTTKDVSSPSKALQQQFELSTRDKKICLRCPVHCPPVNNVKGHWKNKLHDFLIAILMQEGTRKGFGNLKNVSETDICNQENSKKGILGPFLQKIMKWVYRQWS